jgi:UDP-N-acetylglucosamine:LPS N-acetylglucosamine transferase
VRRGYGSPCKEERGYPISLAFNDHSFSAQIFITALGLDNNKKTLLVAASGMRSTTISKTIRQLQATILDAQVIVVTGRDKILYDKLKTNFGPTIHLVDWTNEMPKFILASDLIITKAGGSTVMECIGAQKPVIICKIIPGQEEGNAEYITKHHLGVVALEPDMIGHAAQKILTHQGIYKRNLKQATQPNAALTIAKFLIKLMNK